jgi:hypothetical protein
MENITYALIPEMHGKSVMDPFLLEHYATSYQQHMVIRESILRKYGIYDAFFKEYTNGFQQLVVTNNPKHLTYYDYSSSMIQKYYNFIVNHKLEIQEMLLKDAKTIIEKYKSLR